ncbi:MAG: hypothetical protein QGG54_04590 [Gammaproteobacteria bacterium]|nr:hypothetical protein [Gammaproteobacteria bacterium]MDP6653244.1 hypothetical protein [Gammaproteobacteria bacterium]
MKSTGSRKNSRLRARHKALQSLGSIVPNFSVALDIGSISRHDFYLKLPFRRSAIGILISGGFLAAFSIPLFTVGSSTFGESDGGLFSLVSTLFSLFWMLGLVGWGWGVGAGFSGYDTRA